MPMGDSITLGAATAATFEQGGYRCTLYNLLTGQFIRDLSGHLANKVDQVLSNAPVPIRKRRPDLPRDLANVIHRALEQKPERRYPSVAHFRRALRPFVR